MANTAMDTDKIKIYGARVRVDSMAKVCVWGGGLHVDRMASVRGIVGGNAEKGLHVHPAAPSFPPLNTLMNLGHLPLH